VRLARQGQSVGSVGRMQAGGPPDPFSQSLTLPLPPLTRREGGEDSDYLTRQVLVQVVEGPYCTGAPAFGIAVRVIVTRTLRYPLVRTFTLPDL
jgi:hypothetical protein